MIKKLLNKINPEFDSLCDYIDGRIQKITKKNPKPFFSENTNFLITYADQFQNYQDKPLQLLSQYIDNEFDEAFSHIHILPFYPWSTDDGFSPIDYQKVDPNYGDWSDIENFSQEIMTDCVFNHISSKSVFFQKAIEGDKKAQSMFHCFDQEQVNSAEFQKAIQKVVRPRTNPLMSEYNGKYYWTTFSADQIDTNVNNIEMFRYILDSFFLYLEKGIRCFRIDAIPFVWKELGTTCSHLDNTHNFVKLFRAIGDAIDDEIIIATESNVPHHENISYFGNDDEAHLVYNFSLAPLILHALMFRTNIHLVEWASLVFRTSKTTSFLNFTSSHDGIGLRGLEGLVSYTDIEELCEIAKNKNGQIGYKRSRNGKEYPYELNITWASFLKSEMFTDEENYLRILNSHLICLFFPGIPAMYIHNLYSSENWTEDFEESGIARRLNRKKFDLPLELDESTKNMKDSLLGWLKWKMQQKALAPHAELKMRNYQRNVLSLERISSSQSIRVHWNLTGEKQTVNDRELCPFGLIVIDLESHKTIKASC